MEATKLTLKEYDASIIRSFPIKGEWKGVCPACEAHYVDHTVSLTQDHTQIQFSIECPVGGF